MLTPREAMGLAIAEAKKGAGFVSPNPLVGCVILDRDKRLLAKGFHARIGHDHAEIHALKQISDNSQLDGAHLFVTLEPCAHEGRTPSCAKALAKLPIASVTFGIMDPNPKVSGRGVEILREAGVEVRELREMRDELEDLAEIFLLNQREQRAFVAVKVASSLDGRMALPDGSSQWITGEISRQKVHELRGQFDAVLTGAGTILRDNPRLNSRDARYSDKSQKLIVLDGEELLHDLKNLKLFDVRSANEVIHVVPPRSPAKLDCERLEVGTTDGKFDLRFLVEQLLQKGISSVLVEAGAFTVTQFFASSLVDRFHLFLAPKILGDGLSWINGLNLPALDRALQLEGFATERLDQDLWISARVGRHSRKV